MPQALPITALEYLAISNTFPVLANRIVCVHSRVPGTYCRVCKRRAIEQGLTVVDVPERPAPLACGCKARFPVAVLVPAGAASVGALCARGLSARFPIAFSVQ